MLSDARSEVSACFTDVTSITTCTGKFIYNARTEPIRFPQRHPKIVCNFTQESLPEHVLNSIIHRYISKAVKGDNARPVAGVEPQESPKFYFKIPYIGRFSGIAQHRVRTLVNRFCKPVDIKLVFSTFKIKNLFNVKDSLPDI